MKKILMIVLGITALYGNVSDLNITGIRVSAGCQKIASQKSFQYYAWAGPCPAYSRAQALAFLKRYDIVQDTLPPCSMPDSPPLGETLSRPVPEGYEAVEENITKTTRTSYNGYGKYSSNSGDSRAGTQGVSPAAQGIRINARITSGACQSLSAWINFKADEYGGVITTEEFTRRYRRICDQNDTRFPDPSDNYAVAFEWNEDENNRSRECAAVFQSIEVSRIQNCKKQYQCQVPQACPSDSDPQEVSSYVIPRNRVFHEDIELDGLGFGLHYASNERNNSIAQGWMPSNYAYLKEERLHLGSGSVYVVDVSLLDDGTKSVTFGSNEYIFDANGKLQTIRDIYTKETKTTFSYDLVGNLVTLSDFSGEITTIERDSNGTVTAIVAPTGQRTLLNINADGDLAEVQYEDTSSYAFEYEKHLMTVETEPKGNRFLHFFDENGKIVKVIDAQQGVWRFNARSADTYSTRTVIRAADDTLVYTNHFIENNATTLHSRKELSSGDVIFYENALDDSYYKVSSCGTQHSYTYQKNSNGTLYRDPFTQRRVLEKTVETTQGGVQKVTRFARRYVYDNQGILQRRIDTKTDNGKTSTFTKDFEHHLDLFISPKEKRSYIQYDALMQKVQYIKPYAMYKNFYEYDAQGRVIKETTGERVTTYMYDSRGNISSITDPMQRTTTYAYDSRDRIIQITYADGSTEHFTYDANSNLLSRIVPTPAEYTFDYNGVNKKISNTSPEQKQTTYTYDKQRRVIKVTKPSGKSIETTYTKGRVTSVTTPEGITDYTYACQNNVASISKASDSGIEESIDFSYDAPLLTGITYKGLLNQTILYTYNNDFVPSSISYAGETTDLTYDQDKELVQSGTFNIQRAEHNGLDINITDSTYIKYTHYNRYGEIQTQKDDILEITLKRSKAGQIVEKVEKIKPALGKMGRFGFTKMLPKMKTTYTYKYDSKGRLIKVKKGMQTVEEYSYDSNGNRKEAKLLQQNRFGFGFRTKTYKGTYTLDDSLEVYGDNTYRYDDDGYLVEKTIPDGTTTYTYNTLGSLTKVILPDDTTVEYPQDALNRRVAKKVNGEIVEKYLWEDLTTLLAVYDKDDNLVQRFEYADQRMPVSMTDASGTKYYLHYDQVGSLRAVSDTNGNVVKEITYDTYGNIINDTDKNFRVPFGFAGGLYDPDTKLTHFGYREYDAYTGKWTAKDPILFAGGNSNLYGYVLGDPVEKFDPLGLLEKCRTNGLLYHVFWRDGNGSTGFYPTGSPWGSPGYYQSPDQYHDIPKSCETYPDNSPNKCITQCIMTWPKYHKAPQYNLITHQCHDEAQRIYIKCFQKCWKNK